MRILHTADWHLNDRLGRIDRSDDLRAAVERIAGLCEKEKVDVLLVAGDLFSELARADALRESIRHWQATFTPFLAGGGTILALTGNHDNENFCQTLRHAMALAAPGVDELGQRIAPGRLYLAADPTLLRLPDRKGFDVQFLMLPYPTPGRYLEDGKSPRYHGPEEKIATLVKAFEKTHQDIREHANFDASLPTVLSAHVFVRGANLGSGLFRLSPAEDMMVDDKGLAEQYDYVALGHIHKPQALGGHEHVRYSGSIERLDLGEKTDEKSVVLVDIGKKGREGSPRVLPLPSTPIHEIIIEDPDVDLPHLKQEYVGASQDLVKVKIQYTAGKDILDDILREVDKLFPRCYDREWEERGQLGASLTLGEAERQRSLEETVREYIKAEMRNHDESEIAEILQMTEELLKEIRD